jgi:hypothetical protein
MASIAGTDKRATTVARSGCARSGVTRSGFVPKSVKDTNHTHYMWKDVEPPAAPTWTVVK